MTANVVLTGAVGAAASFELDARLDELTAALRPQVVVDLREVTWLHAAVVSVLIRHARQARRQGGDLVVRRPTSAAARRTLDQIGLIGWAP